jgi:hypothetical protein
MIFNFLKKASKVEQFWKWFVKNNGQYLDSEINTNENKLLILKKQLEKVNSNITFEINVSHIDNIKEFVISADGVKDAIPFVLDLVNNAPLLKNWKIIAFRQPTIDFHTIEIEKQELKLQDVYFRFGKDFGKIALELHVKGFKDSQILSSAIYVLLDNLIGEYSTMSDLSNIEVFELNDDKRNS